MDLTVFPLKEQSTQRSKSRGGVKVIRTITREGKQDEGQEVTQPDTRGRICNKTGNSHWNPKFDTLELCGTFLMLFYVEVVHANCISSAATGKISASQTFTRRTESISCFYFYFFVSSLGESCSPSMPCTFFFGWTVPLTSWEARREQQVGCERERERELQRQEERERVRSREEVWAEVRGRRSWNKNNWKILKGDWSSSLMNIHHL